MSCLNKTRPHICTNPGPITIQFLPHICTNPAPYLYKTRPLSVHFLPPFLYFVPSTEPFNCNSSQNLVVCTITSPYILRLSCGYKLGKAFDLCRTHKTISQELQYARICMLLLLFRPVFRLTSLKSPCILMTDNYLHFTDKF